MQKLQELKAICAHRSYAKTAPQIPRLLSALIIYLFNEYICVYISIPALLHCTLLLTIKHCSEKRHLCCLRTENQIQISQTVLGRK